MKAIDKRIIAVTAVAIFALASLLAAALLAAAYILLVPAAQWPSGAVEFEIRPGERLDSMAERLDSRGLLITPLGLKLAAFIGGRSSGIKAGLHILDRPLNAWDLYWALHRQPARPTPAAYWVLTVPEGRDIFEIATLFEKQGICSLSATAPDATITAGEFLAAASDASLIADLAPDALSLEGYLFPDRYHLPIGAGAREVIGIMLERFRDAVSGDAVAALRARGLTLHEGITLASLIAKEAGNREEMPLISSVFHNRLDERRGRSVGRLLQCDPTFIYARKLAGTWDNAVRAADRGIDSPFNTYLHRGLPPGPICNPGLDALAAAARPAETDFLFFVAKGADISRGHHFSKTSLEHERARRRYREALRNSAQQKTRRPSAR